MKHPIVVEIRPALHLIAVIIRWLSLTFVPPLLAAWYYAESLWPFLIPMLLTAVIGLVGERLTRSPTELGIREGFLVVALAWMSIAVFGAIPYLLFNIDPLNAYFESMSGFTTTGATILNDIAGQPRSL